MRPIVNLNFSLESFLDYASAPEVEKCQVTWQSLSWFNGLTYKQALQMGRTGDEKAVANAERLINQLDAVSIEGYQPTWISAPCGAYPCVPEYLAGYPEPMRSIELKPSDSAPIRIFVGLAFSASFSPAQVESRGTTILALIMKLQQFRNVELYGYHCTGGGLRDGCIMTTIRLENKPLSIAHACFMLTNTAFHRRLCVAVAFKNGTGNNKTHQSYWPAQYSNKTQFLNEVLQVNDNDIVCDQAILNINSECMTAPVKWLNETLAHYNGVTL